MASRKKTTPVRRAPNGKSGRHGALWQLQEAKNRLSEVVQSSLSEGPQTITLHGKPSVVIISVDAYKKLSNRNVPLVEFLIGGLEGSNLRLEREDYPVREIDL